MPYLAALLAGLVGSAGARILSGLGLGLVSFAAITPVVLTALTVARDMTAGITASVLQIILLSGFGEAFSAIGSAMLARAAIDAGRVALQKR